MGRNNSHLNSGLYTSPHLQLSRPREVVKTSGPDERWSILGGELEANGSM